MKAYKQQVSGTCSLLQNKLRNIIIRENKLVLKAIEK